MSPDNNFTKPLSVVLIGSGNVSTHLGKALEKSGNNILQVYSKTSQAAKLLAAKLKSTFTTNLKELNPNADLYILSVKDDAIDSVLSQIKINNGIIIHTSGSVDMAVFENKFKRYGVFYPLQTFSKTKKVNFKNIPICLEANNSNVYEQLYVLANQISTKIHDIDSNQRKKLHLAAVFACNFSNYMYTISDAILTQNGIDTELLRPLIIETANKIKNNSPREMQTGPAKRHDLKIIENHLKLLESFPEYHSIYQILSKSILREYS